MDDAQSAVLLVSPSFDASLIGAGPTGAPLQPLFGNVDFKAYNIDFENRAVTFSALYVYHRLIVLILSMKANFSISQALVTDISYAHASFYGCSFSSYQDTWYTGRNASTYVVDSIIYGQTDCKFKILLGKPLLSLTTLINQISLDSAQRLFFFFCDSTSRAHISFKIRWFQNVVLANRACGGGIVAWKGTNLTDAPGNRYGAYITDSSIIRVSSLHCPQAIIHNYYCSLTFQVPRCKHNDNDRRIVLSRYD